MKLKRILISACVAAASGGLLATVLTSCSSNKIDEDLQINLDEQGAFTNKLRFNEAIKTALSNCNDWSTFKSLIADELIYQWFENRASTSKNAKDRNNEFRDDIEEWKYNIDEDYKKKVDEYKSKYGSNHKFYLQNELLDANGGTEEAYKHFQLVAKAKDKFLESVFANDYFGLAKNEDLENGEAEYPHIFSNVESPVSFDELKNPSSWERLGFYAKTNNGYPVDDLQNTNLLAKYPDGDYAIIQQFVFNEWFKTEKPFFSSAALFKYSKPAQSEGLLSNIYNVNAVKVPDAPNEAFPFFGGMTDSTQTNGYTGTRAFYNWYKELLKGTFIYDSNYGTEAAPLYNGAISIPTNLSEDSQTLLLCYGKQMIGGENSLYIPYAISAASLYMQMFTPGESTKNIVTQQFITDTVGTQEPIYKDTDIIFKLFFYNKNPDEMVDSKGTSIGTIGSRLDLNEIYPDDHRTGELYHSPLFKKNDSYTYLYGSDDTQGVQYITNNIQVPLLTTAARELIAQPWIFELNEAGMHAQTIDCFTYVKPINDQKKKHEALKKAVMFRLMQKKAELPGSGIISASVLGKGGQLENYFKSNLANIILKMALSENKEENIFRSIETYKEIATTTDDLFLYKLVEDEQLGTWSLIKIYINETSLYDRARKAYDAIVTANEKIYAYRSTQIANSKDNLGKKIYENGLLAKLAVVDPEKDISKYPTWILSHYNTAYCYSGIVDVITCGDDELSLSGGKPADRAFLFDQLKAVCYKGGYVNIANGTSADSLISGFSPQVQSAKEASSNRAWFLSPIVDKFMYSFMGEKTLANEIKYDAYDAYIDDQDTKNDFVNKIENDGVFLHGTQSVYIGPKLLTGDKNFASYCADTMSDFFKVMDCGFQAYIATSQLEYGYLLDSSGEWINKSDVTVDYLTYLSTAAYLANNQFENFYKELNKKIGEDQMAFVGYLCKYNSMSHDWLKNPEQPTTYGEYGAYEWSPNVNNIFDQFGYSGRTAGFSRNDRIDSDQYWNVVEKKFEIGDQPTTMAGFTGIQTSGSNQLDSESGLKDAVFKKFAVSTYNSPILESGTTKYHQQNDGALFAWAGEKDADGEQYVIDGATYDGKTIGEEAFVGFPKARKLARKISKCSTVDSLRTLSAQLGEALMGGSEFQEMGRKSFDIDPEDPVNHLKYLMLQALSKKENDTFKYKNAFERVVNVEVHDEIASPYCFETDKEGFKLLLTQINKSDIIEKTIHPVWVDGDPRGHWEMADDAGITIDEFWNIFCKLATDSSIQQQATSEVVKFNFGDKKLEVFDAQLYNQFDSIWIKDWKKKPIGE